MIKTDDYYMDCAYKEALKAYKIDEIPVEAIIKASKKINNWRLNDCILYVTLYPCNMCLEIIKASKIKTIIYASDQYLNQITEKEINITKINNTEIIKDCSNVILNKFNELRIKNK